MSVVLFGSVVAGVAALLWAVALLRVVRSHERRLGELVVPIMATLASLGSLVSVGALYLSQQGVDLNLNAVSILATAIGRGALLMGAVLWLGLYRARPRR